MITIATELGISLNPGSYLDVTEDNARCPVLSRNSSSQCLRPTLYYMTWWDHGKHIGARVCGTHERRLARAHLKRMDPTLDRDDIVKWDMTWK